MSGSSAHFQTTESALTLKSQVCDTSPAQTLGLLLWLRITMGLWDENPKL